MQEVRTLSWILYALDGASGSNGANCNAISEVADGINHAVPTQKEMNESLKWLSQNKLATKVGSYYMVTNEGKRLLTNARMHSDTVSGVWKALTFQIEKIYGDPTADHLAR